MTNLTGHAAWILTVTFAMSLVYELYRSTAMAGTSRHDSMQVFLMKGLPLYIVAAVVIAALFAGMSWAPWAGLLLSVGTIFMATFYYNPHVIFERKPRIIDWIEDLVFTGLAFVAAALLLYDVSGWELRR
jgi:hypothetical protein